MNTAIDELKKLKADLESGKYKIITNDDDGQEYDILSSINKALEYEEPILTPYISIIGEDKYPVEYVNKREFAKEIFDNILNFVIQKYDGDSNVVDVVYVDRIKQIAKQYEVEL